MEVSELLSALENDPTAVSDLEGAIKDAMALDTEDLESFLGELVSGLDKGPAADAILKVLDQTFRRNRVSESGPVLAWHAGLLAWKTLDDRVRAEFFMRALDEGGTHVAEWQEFYRQFYASRGNWLRLEQFMNDLGQRTGASVVDTKRQLARTAQEFDNPSKELSYWQGVLQASPSDDEADSQLERLYTKLERWPSLANLLKARIERIPDDDADGKIALLKQMITIYGEKMRAELKVLATFQQILDADPGNVEAIDSLLTRYEAAGRWPDYAKVLVRKIEHTEGHEELVALRRTQADIMETRFANVLEAVKAYEAILELEPEDQDVIDKLKDLYEKRRDFENLIRVRRMEVDREEDPGRQTELLVELATLATERLRKVPVAVELWERILGIDDSHTDALRNLETLYEREKNVEKLCTILKRRAELAPSADEQVQMMEKLAQIQGTRLNDSEAALATWEHILQVQATHERAKRELRSRYLADHKWDELETFLRQFGTLDELARTLESQVGSISDVEEKQALLFKLAGIWRDEVKQPIRAVKDLEAVLKDAPENLSAATALIDLYKDLSDYKRLPPVYEVAIGGTSPRNERQRLMIEAAEIHEHHLRNTERAFFWYLEAFKEDMGNQSLSGELERLAGPSQNWDIYVAVLEQAAGLIQEDDRKIETYLRVGEIYTDELEEPENALGAFRSAMELEPENRQAISALEALYRKTGDHDALVGILRRRLDMETGESGRKEVHFEIAGVLYHNLGKVDDSVAAYESILDKEPDETRGYDELSELLLAERRFADLADLLGRQVEMLTEDPETDPAVMADLHCRLGTLEYGLHGASMEAVDAWSRALEYMPEHATTLDLLTDLLGNDDLRLAVVSLLKGPYRTLGRFENLADCIEMELQQRGDTETTVGLLWDLNALYGDQAADDGKRFRTLSRVLAVKPGNVDAWDQLEEVAGSLNTWRDLASLYDEAAGRLSGPDQQVQLRLRLARITVDRLDNTELARRIFHEILDVEADNEEALEALENIYETLEDHPELLKIYRRRFDASEYTGEKMAYAFKAASEMANYLDDVEGAINSINLVLDLDPEYAAAYRELDTYYTRAERWDDLANTLLERIRLAEDDDERNYLQLRLAEAREDKLSDLEGAVEVYRSILESNPGHEVSVGQLERLFENTDVRVLIAPILLPAYQETRNLIRQVECWDVLAQAESDPEETIRHYETIAALYEDDIADLDKAFEYRARSYRTAPERENLVNQVLRVGEVREATEEAVLVLCEKVFDIEDEYRRKETHRIVADTCRDRSLDRDLAKRHYNEVLSMEEEDLGALDSLIALYKGDDEVEPLVGLVQRKADLVTDPMERAELLLWAGDILAERLDRPGDAIGTYTAVLDLDPSSQEALVALEGLYEKAERWEELVEILGRKADCAEDVAGKVAALTRKGAVQHEQLGDAAEAVETYLMVLDTDPMDLGTLRTLDRLYGEQEDWLNVYGILEQMFGLLDGEERLPVHYRMGRLLESELGDPSRAVQTYTEILENHPDNGDTLDALEGMVRSDEAAEEAFQILGPSLSENNQWERLFVIYEVITEREEDPARKVANLLTMGEIAQNRLEEPIRSFECYGRAFASDPMNQEALDRVESLAEAYDMWDGVPPMLFEGAAAIEGMPESLVLRMRAAGIRRDRLDDREGAAKDFEAVVADYPDHSEALTSLNSLYGKLEKWDELTRILKMQIEAAPEADEKIAFLLRLGDIAEERLDSADEAMEARREVLYLQSDHEGAVQALRAMFDADRKRAEILELLEPIYQAGEAWDDLAAVYESVYPSVEDEFERKAVLLKLADICLDKMDRKMSALGWRGKALALEPDDEGLLVQIEQLAEENEAWQSLKGILMEAADDCGDDERRVTLWHKAAACSRDRLDEADEAESIFRRILETSESDREALAALDGMYETDQRWEDLLGVLQQECNAAEYDDEKVAFLLRAGALQRDRLDDSDGAVASFAAVLDANESDTFALSALIELHADRGEHEALYTTLGALSDVTESGTERGNILRRMAAIAEEHLDRNDAALEHWEEISRLEPTDPGALKELERLYSDKEDWTAFVDACERELPLVEHDGDRTVDLLRQVAKVSLDRMEDTYMAQHAWKRILDTAPADVEAMQALRGLYRENGDLESLSVILESLAASGAVEGDELKTLCEEHARMLTDELPRPEGAIDLWNRVLSVEPEHAEALEALDRMYEETGAFTSCVDIIKRRSALIEDTEERTEALTRAADLQSDRMEDPEGASATFESILDFASDRLDVYERLQMLYTRMEDWDRLGDLLLRQDGVLEDPGERVQNLSELSRVFEDRKGDKEGAFLIAVKAAQVNPADDMVLAEVWRLAQDNQNWSDYVASLAPIVDRMDESQVQEHLVRFGECLWKRADQPEEAVTWYERTVEKWPEDETAQEALTDLYSSLARNEELVGNLDTRVELTSDFLEKVRLQLWAGKVLETEIADGDRALAAYRKVLEFDDGNLEALKQLTGLHQAREEWEDLLKILETLAPLEMDSEVATRLRMGDILERRVQDADRAIQVYEDVLSLEPTEETALDRLQALYGAKNNWQGLAQVYERLLDYSSDTPDRILFCGRLGLLYEEALEDKPKALEFYQRILDMDPADNETFETCIRLFTDMEDWMELVNMLESCVTRTEDDGVKTATLARIADVYENRMEDLNATISSYQRVLDIDERHVETYSELARLFGLMEAWEDVVATIMRWKEQVSESEFIELMLRAATIVKERLENPDRSIKLLGDVLRVDPLNEAAAEKMRLIYTEFEDWEKVADVYLQQEQHVEDDEGKARLRSQAAEVFLTRLKDEATAVQHFERALELNPRMQDVSLSLARAYVAAEQWEKAVPLLDLQLSETEADCQPQRAAEIHFQLGLCAEKLFDHDKAFREFQSASKMAPEHPGIITGLARLYQRKELWQLAKDHFQKALDLAGEELEGGLDEDALVDISFALGEVTLELGEFDEATAFLDRVQEARPDHDKASELLIAIAEKSGDWAGVIKYKQALVLSRDDPFDKFAVLLEIGDIYKERLENTYGAVSAYKEALDVDQDAKVALLRLLELYLDTNAIEDAMFTLERLANAEESPEKRALHYIRMAALYQEKMGDDARAIDHLNQALDADPDRLEAFRAIDEILTNNKDWAAQAQNYRLMVERIRDGGNPELEYRLYLNLGEIYRSRLKEIDYAISAYSRATQVKPEEIKSHEILAQLYEFTGDQFDKAVDEHRAIVNTDPFDANVALSTKAMRRLYLEMQEFDKAFITASALVGLGQSDETETEFFEGNLEPSLPWFKGTIDQLRWESHLLAGRENALLGHILQILYQGIGSELGTRELKELGLKKKNELDLDQKLLFANVYKAASKALGPLPHKVYRDDGSIGLKLEMLSPPGLIVGADMLTGHGEREVAFLIGRQLSFLHPMHFVAAVKNMTELKVFMAAVMKFCNPATQVSTGADVVTELVKVIDRRMPQQQKNQMAKLVSDLTARGELVDFGPLFDDFFVSMERTALRAGTLVCGSIDTALDILRSEEAGFSTMTQKERMQEVVRFGISEDHFVLRRALGIALEAG